MSKKGVEQKPSYTALFAALYRAIANKEFKNEGFGSDYLAEYFLPSLYKYLIKFKVIRASIKNKSNKLTPGVYEYTLARTVFFDSVFTDALNKNIPQIVLLGAGYDTRAYRFARLNNGTRIFELEIAPTLNRKKKYLKKVKIDFPKHAILVPIDFNNESLRNVLENAGYDSNQKTLFMWEGVSYYLEPDSVDATLEFIKNFSHDESVIAFDYAISISGENVNNYYGAKEFTETWRKRRSGEPFRFTVSEGKIESFLKQRGLKMVKHLDNKQIEKMFLLNENGSLVGQITGLFRFAMASSNSNPQSKASVTRTS